MDESVIKELERAELFAREPWRKDLWDAANLIERQGLCKGDFYSEGSYCTLGALGWDSGTDSSDSRIFAAGREFGKRIGVAIYNDADEYDVESVVDTVAGWNDAPERTQAEVVAKLRAVAMGQTA